MQDTISHQQPPPDSPAWNSFFNSTSSLSSPTDGAAKTIFYKYALCRGVVRIHVRNRDCIRLGPLKDALATELQRRSPFGTVKTKPTRQSPAEAMKKSLGSPLKPTVPGPRESARTLTSEKAPDIMPKPRPTTEMKKKC